MSKSTGNFLTLEEAVELYSADGTRYGCALAGDTYALPFPFIPSLDDANFDTSAVSSFIITEYNNNQLFQGVLNGTLPTVHRSQENYIKAVCDDWRFYPLG